MSRGPVAGGARRFLHVSSVEVFERHIPIVETVIFEECGHVPMAEQPENAAAFYADFLSTSRALISGK